MKIAIDARMYGTEHGGIGRYIVNVVSELQKLDQENHYYLLLTKKYYESLKLVNKNWEKVLVDCRHYSFSEQLIVSKTLNSLAPDLVHFPHFNVPVLYKGKFIVTVHDLLMHRRTGASATTLSLPVYLVKRVGYKHVFRNAVERADKIIVPTNYVKNELARTYPTGKRKTKVIYEGIDKSTFSSTKGSAFLRKSGIKDPYFLYVGSVYPHKNVERLVEALAFLNSTRDSKVLLVIVTPRNVFQNRLDEYVKRNSAEGLVKFTGYVADKDLSSLYQNAKAFVYPSKDEGFGLPGLEAMVNNCLLLASDIPVFREVYGDNASYFNPLDFSSIEKAMREALDIPAPRLREIVKKANSFALKYSWAKNAKETLKLYRRK